VSRARIAAGETRGGVQGHGDLQRVLGLVADGAGGGARIAMQLGPEPLGDLCGEGLPVVDAHSALADDAARA
jgi:hypothetical protein